MRSDLGVMGLMAFALLSAPSPASATFRILMKGVVEAPNIDMGDGFVAPGSDMTGLPFSLSVRVMNENQILSVRNSTGIIDYPGQHLIIDAAPLITFSVGEITKSAFYLMRISFSSFPDGGYSSFGVVTLTRNPYFLQLPPPNGLRYFNLTREISAGFQLPTSLIDVSSIDTLPRALRIRPDYQDSGAYRVTGELSINGQPSIRGATAVLANLDTQSWSLSVPEPGTWMMMLAGFAMIGTAMRRRPLAVAD